MTEQRAFQIAIDGTAASGKSTVAKQVAERLKISYLDTGKLYRAVALTFLESEPDTAASEWTDEIARDILGSTSLSLQPAESEECRVMLEGEDVTDLLGEPRVELVTSLAARLPFVREWLLDLQRDLGRDHSVVMAGRDIGTVVLPNATLKVFMVADLHERARRRLLQQGVHFGPEELAQAVADLGARDERDSSRDCAPMIAATDALHLDSTGHTPEELVDMILEQLQGKGAAS